MNVSPSFCFLSNLYFLPTETTTGHVNGMETLRKTKIKLLRAMQMKYLWNIFIDFDTLIHI